MKLHRIFSGIFLLMMLSISCRQKQSDTNTQLHDSLAYVSFQKCSSDTSQSYWIAVPGGDRSDEMKPLIIAFDPHGDGRLAVNSLMGAVTGPGYIVAGSNVIRNGYENFEYAFSALREDILKHFNIDKGRIYAAGFSGGGRFAQIFSQIYPDTKAVISIGAGTIFSRSAKPVNVLPVLFMAGNEDFNYMEINNSIEAMISMGFQSYFFGFSGRHEWPSKSIMDEAILWFEFDDCRRNKNRKNDTLIRDYLDKITDNAGRLKAGGDELQACQEYEKGMAFLDGLVNTKSISKDIESLKKSRSYGDQVKQKEHVSSLEIRLQQGYLQALSQKDTSWWRKEISNLDRELKGEKDVYTISALIRVKNFISMASYSFCNEALRSGDLDRAARFIEIYRIVDPDNPDADYFRALYFYKSGKTGKAKEYFREAVNRGFTDFKKAAGDLSDEIYKSGLVKD